MANRYEYENSILDSIEHGQKMFKKLALQMKEYTYEEIQVIDKKLGEALREIHPVINKFNQ